MPLGEARAVGVYSAPMPAKERAWGVTGATLVLASVALIGGCEREASVPAAPPPPREVAIYQVEQFDIPVEYDFVGRTGSSQRVEIRARVAGYLDEIAYEEGEFVEEGETLFKLDPLPFESRLRAAQAELAQQQARLDNAESLLRRIEPLAEVEAIAEKEIDDARGRVSEAAAAVEAASAGVYDAELNLGYTEITSPVRGLSSTSSQREGAYISAGTGSLTYVARIDPMWVEFSIAEAQLLRARRQGVDNAIIFPEDDQFEVAIELSDGTVHPHTGRISFSDASISTSTGAVLIRAEVPNPEEVLRPGQYVRVLVRGAKRPDAIAVPQRAVFEGPRGSYVWVVGRDGQAEQRPVQVGPWLDDGWVIEKGLGAGDRIIVTGTMGLRPASPISITRVLTTEEVREQGDGS